MQNTSSASASQQLPESTSDSSGGASVSFAKNSKSSPPLHFGITTFSQKAACSSGEEVVRSSKHLKGELSKTSEGVLTTLDVFVMCLLALWYPTILEEADQGTHGSKWLRGSLQKTRSRLPRFPRNPAHGHLSEASQPRGHGVTASKATLYLTLKRHVVLKLHDIPSTSPFLPGASVYLLYDRHAILHSVGSFVFCLASF